tara:strand:+ start:1661 stop:1972 length:312 start_codon:yes stop_codon:yes gene_type:complete
MEVFKSKLSQEKRSSIEEYKGRSGFYLFEDGELWIVPKKNITTWCYPFMLCDNMVDYKDLYDLDPLLDKVDDQVNKKEIEKNEGLKESFVLELVKTLTREKDK